MSEERGEMTRARTLRGEVAQAHLAAFGTEFQLCFSSYPYRSLSVVRAKRVDDPPYGDGCKVGTESGSVYVCGKKAVGLWTHQKKASPKQCHTVTVSYPPSFIFYIANF